MDRDVCVRVPPSGPGAKGDSEDCWDKVHGPAYKKYSSLVMVQVLDEQSTGAVRGSSKKIAGQSRFPETALTKAVSSRPSISKSPCLEVVRSALQRKSSTAALERISAARRPPHSKGVRGQVEHFC